MPDIGSKSEGGKFYALSAESQSFHNIINDFEELGIDSPSNEAERKQFKDLRNQYLIENGIDKTEYNNAVKQYNELTKKGEDLRFGDGGALGFTTRTLSRTAGEIGMGGLNLYLGALETLLPEHIEKSLYNLDKQVFDKLPTSFKQNIGSFLDPYHGEGITTTGGDLSSADAEYMVGKIAGYLYGGGIVKQVIGKGTRIINPKQKFDILNLNKATKLIKDGLYIDTAATIIDDPDENMVNIIYDAFPQTRPALESLYVNPNDKSGQAYMQSFINNLGVGVGFGSVLIGSLKTSGMTWSNLAEGASKLKNSKPVQTALDVTKINPALEKASQIHGKYFSAYRGIKDDELRNAIIKADKEQEATLKEIKIQNNEFDVISKKELKGNKLFDPSTKEGTKNLDDLFNNINNPKYAKRLAELQDKAPQTAERLLKMRTTVDDYATTIEKYLPKGSKLGETIRNNKGTYLTRSYKIFDDTKFRKVLKGNAEKYLNKTLKDEEVDKMFQTAERELRKAGVAAEDIPNAIRQIVNYTGDNAEITETLINANLVKNKLKTKRKLDNKKWLRDLYGEKRGSFENYLTTIEKLGETTAQFKFLDEIREIMLRKRYAVEVKPHQRGGRTINPATGDEIIPAKALDEGMDKSLAQAAAIRIKNTSGLKDGYTNPLKYLYSNDPFIINAIEKGFNPAIKTNILGQAIMGTKAVSQASKTALNPTTHTVNISGNVVMMAGSGIPLAIFKPGNLKKAYKALYADIFERGDEAATQYLKSLIEKGVIGSNVNIGQLKASFQDIDRWGIGDQFNKKITKSGDSYAKDLANLTKETAKTGGVKPTARIIKGLYKTYQAEDDIFKIIHFEEMKKIYGKATGLTGKELDDYAANITRDTMPNYNLVPEFFKQLRKYPVGNFVAWPLEVLRTSKNGFKRAYEDISGRTVKNIEEKYGKKLSEEQISLLRKAGSKRLVGLMLAGTAGDMAMDASMNLYDITAEQAQAMANLSPPWEQKAPKVFTGPINVDTNGHVGIDYYNLGTLDPYQYVKAMFKHAYALTNGAFNKDLTDVDYIKMMVAAADETLGPYAGPSIITEALYDTMVGTPRGLTDAEDKVGFYGTTIGKAFIPPDIERFFNKRRAYEASMEKQGLEKDPETGKYPNKYGISGYGYSINQNDAMQLFGLREKRMDLTANLRRDLQRIGTDMRDAGLQFNNIVKDPTIIAPQEIYDSYYKSLKADFEYQQEAKSILDNYKALGITPTSDFMGRNVFYDALTMKNPLKEVMSQLEKFTIISDNRFIPTLDPTTDAVMGAANKSNSPYFTNINLRNAIIEDYTKNQLRELR
tara:strand:+ start:567 stop:4532 length:3966 start_codon:yes stop_codon:yes gene_type:complete